MPRWRSVTVEDYDRVIAFLEELGLAAFRPMQRQCRRERKSLVLREKVKRQLQDPEFNQRLRAGRTAAYKDPQREAIRVEKFRKSFQKVPRALPPMTADQRREYKRMRHAGAKRPDILRVILKPSGGLTAQSPAGRPAPTPDRVLAGPTATLPRQSAREISP